MKFTALAILGILVCAAAPSAAGTANLSRSGAEQTVSQTVRPLMAKYGIPGVAVGLVVDGKSYVFDYGVASKKTLRPVGPDTLFEIGSLSKTFTATMASYAALSGSLSLSDATAAYFPSLRGTSFGAATLLNLATHTVGRLPMQVPDGISDDDQLLRYVAAWHSGDAPGTQRVYSNIGIGMLGLITARSMHQEFATLMERRLFPALGLKNTYIDIPAAKTAEYAEGYTRSGHPVRMRPGELWKEAYGVRTTAADMARFIAENMNLVAIDPAYQRAIDATHTGYFAVGPMTQDLIWEQYAYPVARKTVLDGTAMIEDVVPAREMRPPERPTADVLLNKTGSTNGFAAYAAFVPAKHLGIVILANRNFSLLARVRAAYDILAALSYAARPSSRSKLRY